MHACLSCGSQILEGQDEAMVPGRRKNAQDVRYQHADYRDCQAALGQPHPRTSNRDGIIPALPTLEHIERGLR